MSSYKRLRDECRSLERTLAATRSRALTLSIAHLRTTDHDYRSCGCPECCAARAVQGIAKESTRQQTLRGVA